MSDSGPDDDDLDATVLVKLAGIAAGGTADRLIAGVMEREALRGLTGRLPENMRDRAGEAVRGMRAGLTRSLGDLLADLPQPVVDRLASSGDVPGEARRIVEEALPGLRDDIQRTIRDLLDNRREPPESEDPPG